MNKKMFVGIALVVIIAIAISGLFFPKATQTVVNKLGAVSSLNEVTDGYVKINGVEYYYYNSGLTATSSVLCSIKNPWFGNSKAALVSFTAHGTTTSTAAGGMDDQVADLATSTTAFATSSPAYLKEIPINVDGGVKAWSVVWTGSATTTNTRIIGEVQSNTGASHNVIGTSEYLNFRVSTTSSPGTFTTYETGACNAVLMKI